MAANCATAVSHSDIQRARKTERVPFHIGIGAVPHTEIDAS